ncbi:hypothetical protein JTE90_004342 [Oedothorax gibbosus]|uniref:Serpin domain-containing protein n=1 Tax=Oedothorax gibbosus TaxID=931172 RepID=A0AAV6VLY7_9ARAC|nr:hypothetical protein JTE90_004342 [Oedothorax gibbosus]
MARPSLFYSFFTLLITLSIRTSSADKDCTVSELAQANMRKLAVANNELAINLHKSLTSGSSENVFFSPLSISTAFGMLFYGARGGTAEELRNALGYNKADLPDELVHTTFKDFLKEILNSGDSNSGYVLNTANSVLIEKYMKLSPDYKNDVEDLYQASVEDVDFAKDSAQVVSKINNWVKQKTNGKIEKLLDELDASTVLVLLNAVYFKGTWKVMFDEKKTRPEVFFNRGLESSGKNIPMMHMKEEPYSGKTIGNPISA